MHNFKYHSNSIKIIDRSTLDYYCFGSVIPNRTKVIEDDYRYGFNNQEKDPEIGEYYAFEYRIHDARLGRFLSIDPLEKKYPWNSPYAFAENRVIDGKDLEGLEYINSTNNNISCQQKNADGTYSVTISGKEYSGIQGVEVNGTLYYEVKEHLYGKCGNPDEDKRITVEIWYYMYKHTSPNSLNPKSLEGAGHAMMYDMQRGTVYEINHQNSKEDKFSENGFYYWLDFNKSTHKSTYYVWNLNVPDTKGHEDAYGLGRGSNDFWNYKGGRGFVDLYPVVLENPEDVIKFYTSKQDGDVWNYNLLTNNCKHYVCKGLQAGGLEFNMGSAFPGDWNYSAPMYRWTNANQVGTKTPFVYNSIENEYLFNKINLIDPVELELQY